MSVTGEERMPLLTRGGKVMALREVKDASGLHKVPLIGAVPGGTGNAISIDQIKNAPSTYDNFRIPLVSGGAFVTVSQVRNYAANSGYGRGYGQRYGGHA